VNALHTLQTTFGSCFGQVVLPEDGYYTLKVQSAQSCSFFGASSIQADQMANLKIGFGFLFKDEYRACHSEDTFSVTGVWSKQSGVVQVHPPEFVSPQAITLNVIFKGSEIYVAQDSRLLIKLTIQKDGRNNN
jgi:hypothetical protein